MKKFLRLLGVCFLLACLLNAVGIAKDKAFLRREMIRLHVVAQSDSPDDQCVKLQVKDAVISFLQDNMPQSIEVKDAKEYLNEHLQELEDLANTVLAKCGHSASARVTLTEEAFPLRKYETFTLPSGVYESLRVTIGAGEGQNWWCVVFPSLCLGATEQEFEDIAVSAGLSKQLIDTTMRNEGYEIRFFFLDCLGKLENLFHFR